MAHVLRVEQAERDLEDVLAYLDQHSPPAATRFATTLDQRCRTYAQFPEIGRAREELAHGLRSFTTGQHVVFYRPIADGIEVIRIVHGARDIPALFE